MKPSSSGKTSAASIAARLRNAARTHGISVEAARDHFAREGFLRRLAKTAHAEDFILKGSVLLLAWLKDFYRPTLDADFLVRRAMEPEELRRVITEIATIADDDRIIFDPGSIRLETMQEGQRIPGQRLMMSGSLGSGTVHFRADIGFADVITPRPTPVQLEGLFAEPITVLGSTVTTVIAEKFDAMVDRGLANTRMKDYYDLAVLSRTQTIDGDELVDALRATFTNRGRPLPAAWPPSLNALAHDERQSAMWKSFLAEIRQPGFARLEQAIEEIAALLGEPLQHVEPRRRFAKRWLAGIGWR